MTANDSNLNDPIDVEREQPELGARLRDALREFDTDSDDFAEGVRARVNELGTHRRAQRSAAPELTTGWRRAASLLPPVLLPKGLAKLGVGSGGALLGKSGSLTGEGGVLGLAAVPAITLAMLVIGAWAALRSLLRAPTSRDQHDDRQWAREEVFAWWRENMLVAPLVIAALIALAFYAPADALTLLLIVSTLALCGIFGRLVAGGVASRREVGQRAGGFLLTMLMWGIGFLQPSTLSRANLAGSVWIVPLIGLGGGVCLTLARAETRRRRWAGAAASTAYFALLLALMTWMAPAIGKRAHGPDDLHRWAQQPIADEHVGTLWATLARVTEHWNAAGLGRLDLSGAVPTAQARQASVSRRGVQLMLPLIELGFVDDGIAANWRDRENERTVLLHPRGALDARDHLTLRLAARAGAYSEADKDTAAATVVREATTHDHFLALHSLLLSARTLEVLERSERIGDLADLARETLSARWILSSDGERGCFTDLLSGSRGDLNERALLSSSNTDTTSAAVRVMARWGVPEAVDLRALERWLIATTEQYVNADLSLQNVTAIAVREELRTFPELRALHGSAEEPSVPASMLAELWRWRVLLAAFLLVSFAVFTTWRAPVRERDPEEHDWWAGVRFGSKRD